MLRARSRSQDRPFASERVGYEDGAISRFASVIVITVRRLYASSSKRRPIAPREIHCCLVFVLRLGGLMFDCDRYLLHEDSEHGTNGDRRRRGLFRVPGDWIIVWVFFFIRLFGWRRRSWGILKGSSFVCFV